MAAKRTRPATAEELEVGTAVLYDDGQKGYISDAFGALDQYWVKDSTSDEPVRHTDGDLKTFSAAQLQLPPDAPPAKRAATDQSNSGAQVNPEAIGPRKQARVLVLGTENQMLHVLEHFGEPDAAVRREPQMLLAVPCSSCCLGNENDRFDPEKLLSESCPLNSIASGGIDDNMRQLAQNLRPDRGGRIGMRAFALKQAVEQLGPEVVDLEGYYALSAVSMPYGWSTIEANYGERRRYMQDVRCHIELGVTAEGEQLEEEDALESTAVRVLGEACGIRINEPIWEEEVQFRLRKLLSVDIPLTFWDGPLVKTFVLILPSDLKVVDEGGLLTFREPGPLAYGESVMLARTVHVPGVATSDGDSHQVGGKSVAEWKAEQLQLFGHLPKLPEDWIRIKARNTDQIYFWHTKKMISQYDHPLPPGWTKQRSKTSGKVYYFNAATRQSVYVPPTEP